ncbi:MAG: hypothetical protein Tsb0020_32230 [Haliangiales bacterium]
MSRPGGNAALRKASVILIATLALVIAWPVGLALIDEPAADSDDSWLPAAEAQRRSNRRRRGRRRAPARENKKPANQQPAKDKVFDFTGLDISGQLRAPQLLYFLDRANEELERASLERRSFVPEMIRSVDEESL